MGAQPLQLSEIDALQRLTRIALSSWEIDLLDALDSCWLRVTSDTKWDWSPDDE